MSEDTGASRARQRLTGAQRALLAEPRTVAMILGIARRFARRRGLDVDEVRAVVEDAAIAAARRFDPGRGVWFVTFAARRARGALMRWYSARYGRWDVVIPVDSYLLERMSGDGDPWQQLAREQLALAIVEACKALPLDQSRMVEGVYSEGLPVRRVGAELGMSASAATRLHRDALARIRFELAKRGLTDGGGDGHA